MALKTSLSLTTAAFLLGVATPALLTAASDHATLPPSAAEMLARMEPQLPLERAIGVAESDVGGRAGQAAYEGANVRVRVYEKDGATDVVLDGASGRVLSKTPVSRFPGEPARGEWTELPSGLKYYELRVGDGAMPAGPTSSVRVHYSGWLLNGTKFDSSVDRGDPIVFPLNGVIRGWTEGVGSMRVGGKRKLIIPYDLAYGEGGRGPIPPRATLVFDVELLEVMD
jgi:hypothetical protein